MTDKPNNLLLKNVRPMGSTPTNITVKDGLI